jgi:hypothetical protein
MIPQLSVTKRTIASTKKIFYKDFGALTIDDYVTFSRLPDHPFWSPIEQAIDFSFADELFSNLYTPYSKRPYAPSLLLKLHLVKTLNHLSDIELENIVMFDMAIRRFVGVPMSYKRFDPTTLGQVHEPGAYLFRACFHSILSQLYLKKLWGNHGEQWLREMIQPYSNKKLNDQHRKIWHTLLTLVQYMKKSHTPMFHQAIRSLQFGDWLKRLPADATREERITAHSLLIARAYAFLFWLEQESIQTLFQQWTSAHLQKGFLELQAGLFSLLKECSRENAREDNG